MLAGTLKLNYSCPDELSEKNHLFHKISYFHESFRTLGEKCSKLCPTLFFGRAIEKATYVSRGSLWRKAKFFKCFKKRCFFNNCLWIIIGEVCTFGKKTIVLVLITLFYVSRGTFPEKIFVSKSFFFLKIRGFWEKNFRIFVKLFPARLTSFHPTFAEEGFRGKFSRKKYFFFIVSRLGAKNRLLKEQQDLCENFILRVWWNFLRENTLFKEYMIYFFMYFERRIVKFEKKFRRIVKIAFYTSRGTSWCNCFGSLKTYFP